MLRSMNAGVAGMKGFQTKLDVIGNNIANVSTVGFKKGRVTFQDMMSQTTNNAQGPTENRGGVNSKQVGTGSQIGTIDTVHTQGFRDTTDITLDLLLQGDGMFIVKRDGEDTEPMYTRAGNFGLDTEGNIVNPDGYYLLDIEGKEINIPSNAESYSIGTDGKVTYIEAGQDEPQEAGQIGVQLFSNPGGLEKVGGSLYRNTPNAGRVEENNVPQIGIPEEGGAASIISGALEMSNVDLAEEFTDMITAQRGFQANTRIITTSDEILQELVNLKR